MRFDWLQMGDNNEQPTCASSDCIGCDAIDDCNDVIIHITSTLKKRMAGLITHEELVAENSRRLGPEKPKTQIHWKYLINDMEQTIRDITLLPDAVRERTVSKLTEDARAKLQNVFVNLNRNGWFAPYMDDGELKFKTTKKPIGALTIMDSFIHEQDNVEPEQNRWEA